MHFLLQSYEPLLGESSSAESDGSSDSLLTSAIRARVERRLISLTAACLKEERRILELLSPRSLTLSTVDVELQMVQLLNVERLDRACSNALRKCPEASREELEALDAEFDNPSSLDKLIVKPVIAFKCCVIL